MKILSLTIEFINTIIDDSFFICELIGKSKYIPERMENKNVLKKEIKIQRNIWKIFELYEVTHIIS